MHNEFGPSPKETDQHHSERLLAVIIAKPHSIGRSSGVRYRRPRRTPASNSAIRNSEATSSTGEMPFPAAPALITAAGLKPRELSYLA